MQSADSRLSHGALRVANPIYRLQSRAAPYPGHLRRICPRILRLDDLEPVVDVHDGDSILLAQKLASELGLGVGISSGANFLAAVKVQNELGSDAVVATVLADDNKKYL